MMGSSAHWVAFVGDNLHSAGILLALALPMLRASVRRLRGVEKCFISRYVVHDIASGLSLPGFLALCLISIAPSLLAELDKHTLTLAGALGIVFILSELFGTE